MLRMTTMAGLLIAMRSLSAAAEPEAPNFDKSPLFASGDLQRLHEPLAKVFQFKLVDGNLTIDRHAWEQNAKDFNKNNPEPDDPLEKAQQQAMANDPKAAAQMKMAMAMARMMQEGSGPKPPIMALFESIRQASDSHGGGSGSSGIGDDARWDASFSSATLSGRVEATRKSESLAFQELQMPKRKLEFRTFDQGAFRIQLTNRDGAMISLRNGPSGRFSVVMISGDSMFADQAASFGDFAKKHRRLLEGDLLPVLERFGIQPPLPDAKE